MGSLTVLTHGADTDIDFTLSMTSHWVPLKRYLSPKHLYFVQAIEVTQAEFSFFFLSNNEAGKRTRSKSVCDWRVVITFVLASNPFWDS
jgi:hypothetical protein